MIDSFNALRYKLLPCKGIFRNNRRPAFPKISNEVIVQLLQCQLIPLVFIGRRLAIDFAPRLGVLVSRSYQEHSGKNKILPTLQHCRDTGQVGNLVQSVALETFVTQGDVNGRHHNIGLKQLFMSNTVFLLPKILADILICTTTSRTTE